MGRKCSIIGCKTGYASQKKTDRKLIVYRFPKDPEELRLWIRNIPNKLSVDKITPYMGVCELHFPEGVTVKLFGNHHTPTEPPSIFPGVPNSCCATPPRHNTKASAGLSVRNPALDEEMPPRELPINLAEALIAAVRKREQLYNAQHAGYKSQHQTELAWKEVSEEVGRDVTFCRTKWAQMRATYNKILAQIKLQLNGEAPSKAIKWYLYHQMSFIKDHVVQGASFPNILNQMSTTDVRRGAWVPTTLRVESEDTLSHASSSSGTREDDENGAARVQSQIGETGFSSGYQEDESDIKVKVEPRDPAFESDGGEMDTPGPATDLDMKVEPPDSIVENEMTVKAPHPTMMVMKVNTLALGSVLESNMKGNPLGPVLVSSMNVNALALATEKDKAVDPLASGTGVDTTASAMGYDQEIDTPAKRKRKTDQSTHRTCPDPLHVDKQQCHTTKDDDENDMNFLKFLLPLVKEMTPRNKRIFYQKAVILCNEILDDQNS